MTENSPIDKALDEHIGLLSDKYVEEQNSLQGQLLSSQNLKEKFQYKLKSELEMPVLSNYLIKAISLIKEDSQKYLDQIDDQKLQDAISLAEEKLFELNINDVLDNDLCTLIGIDEQTLEAIQKIALAKYDEQQPLEATSLFTLLSTLKPSQANYWLRVGISAQEANLQEYALRAFVAAIELHPNNFLAHLLVCETLFKLNRREEAKEQLRVAEAIGDVQAPSESQQQLILQLKSA